jgi:guanine nucleotide-binding protein G(I)/G(S)/G(T) subunit beta-1
MAAAEEMADIVKGLLDQVETARLERNTTAGTNKIAEKAATRDSSVYEFTCRRRLLGHLGKVYAHHWSGADDRLVSASQDSKLIDWNAMTEGKMHLVELSNGWVMTCGFDQTMPPRFVASGGLDNGCTVYDVSGDSPMVKEPAAVMTGHDGYTSCVRFIKDSGTVVSSSGDTTCIVWDVRSEAQIVRLHDHAADVMG